jgi:prenylcysteine oxidase/farnesylcysteine lyase
MILHVYLQLFIYVHRSVAQLRSALVTQYNNNTEAWTTMESLMYRLNYTEALSETASSFFKSRGVSERLYSELIDSATRVNYGQNVHEIHGLGGSVCLMTSGATSVLGGNWQIFENFLNASGATVFLNSTASVPNLHSITAIQCDPGQKHQVER